MANYTIEPLMFEVFIEGDRGLGEKQPTSYEERPPYHALQIKRVTGGKNVNEALIEVDLSVEEQQYLQDVNIADYVGKHCAIKHRGRWIHVGQLVDTSIGIDRDQTLQLTSRLEPYLCGAPIIGTQIRHPEDDFAEVRSKFFVVADDMVFNEEADGVITPNMGQEFTPEDGSNPYRVFVDPDSLQTEASKTANNGGEDAESWTLLHAIKHIFGRSGASSGFVLSSDADIIFQLGYNTRSDQTTVATNTDLLRNARLRSGQYLPQLLDDLLEPFGISWYFSLEQPPGEESSLPPKHTIKFFRRGWTGAGPNDALIVMQRVGEHLDVFLTSVQSLQIEHSVNTLANTIVVMGDFPEMEVTIELVKCWSATHDNATEAQLVQDSPDWETTPAYRDVWRKWGANEAGDYNGLRTEITEAYDFADIFDESINEDNKDWVQFMALGKGDNVRACAPRRRHFFPCHTLGSDGDPIGNVQGIHVQWWNNDGAGSWHDISELGGSMVRISHRELSIRFDGELPPFEIMRQGDNAKIRVTGVVKADARIQCIASSLDLPDRPAGDVKSPNPASVYGIVDARDRFHYKQIHSSSIYHDLVESEDLEATTTDESDKMQEYADKLVDVYDAANTQGQLVVHGMNHAMLNLLELGTSVKEIRERNISWRTPSDLFTGEERLPQIVGFTIDTQQQQITLALDTLKQEIPV